MPYHVTGPHAGRTACPLCIYGNRAGIQIWTGPAGLADAVAIASGAEALIEAHGTLNLGGYVIYVPPPDETRALSEDRLRRSFANTPLRHVFLTVAPPPDDPDRLAYTINTDSPEVRTTVILHANRHVYASWIALSIDEPRWAELTKSVARAIEASRPYEGITVPLISEQEPGERLVFGGRVLDMNGRPLPGAAVIAYNADAQGLYNPPNSPTRMPRIRATAVTDDLGRFRFLTVRPAPYPDRSQPAHIHLLVAAPAHDVRHLEYWFHDDPLITAARRRHAARDDSCAIVALEQHDGTWSFTKDIRLSGN